MGAEGSRCLSDSDRRVCEENIFSILCNDVMLSRETRAGLVTLCHEDSK